MPSALLRRLLIALALLLAVAACDEDRTTLHIVSGSENRSLEPMIQEWAQAHDVAVTMDYQGSVDIANALASGDLDADAVWPAASIWLDMGRSIDVRHARSVFTSPIVLAMQVPVADRAGLEGDSIGYDRLREGAMRGEFRLAMTSATQSNSGAATYLGLLSALAGNPDALGPDDLANPAVRDGATAFLRVIDRSSGSSGWLGESMAARPDAYDAMLNYEVVALETSAALRARGLPGLRLFAVEDGAAAADSPLAFVPRPGADADSLQRREQAFLDLQSWLLAPEQAARIGQTGRRPPALSGIAATGPIWAEAEGADPTRTAVTVRTPAPDVIRAALALYQTELRKPSATIWVVDTSGSMKGAPLAEVKDALHMLLDPAQAERHLLQASARDVTILVPFSSVPGDPIMVDHGDAASVRAALSAIDALEAGGGTELYLALNAAMDLAARNGFDDAGRLPAIIAMTDGQSDDAGKTAFLRASNSELPVHTIAFGQADSAQLAEVSQPSAGRSFASGSGLARTLREAKGYN